MENSEAIYLDSPTHHFQRAAMFQVYARAADGKGLDSSELKSRAIYEIALAFESMAVTMSRQNDLTTS